MLRNGVNYEDLYVNLFSFRKISAQNVNPNKAVGFDMIPSHVLKIAAEELMSPPGASPPYRNFQSMYFRKVLAEFMEEGRVDPSVQKKRTRWGTAIIDISLF